MSGHQSVSIKDSIAARLLKVVFGLYFIIAVSVTLVHMMAEYYHTKDDVSKELKQFQITFQESLADGLWNLQSTNVEATLSGILTTSIIVGVKIENEMGIVIGSGGEILDSKGKRYRLGINVDLFAEKNELFLDNNSVAGQSEGFSDLFGHSFPIIYSDADRKIGTATLYSSTGIVFEKVQYGFVFLAVNSLIKTLSLWIIFLWFSQKLLHKPLSKLTRSTEQLNMDNLDDFKLDVGTSGRNELKVLERTFNSMVGNLSRARKKLRNYTSELEYMKSNLEKLVKERTSELKLAYEDAARARDMADEARDQAIAANHTKSRFLSNMSHEIRTPMNAILGFTQILLRDKAISKSQHDGIVTIQKSGNNLLDIINDILDMSKIEAGHMELKPTDFNLSELVGDLSMMFRMRCEQKGIRWESRGIGDDEELFLNGDEGKIRQVLVNLLGNAAKFTEKGSVALKCRQLDGLQFLFEVKDTGAGIQASALETIFDPFRQEEQGVEKGGTGLGLAISKKQVALMGGELKVDSQLGKGSRFYFTLDLSPALEEINPSRMEDRKVIGLKPGESVKALIVDDHPLNRVILSKMLMDIGVEINEAENGLVALAKIEKDAPDIVFIDFRMPKMDGVEAIKHIRSDSGNRIKIVLVTATAYDHEFEALRICGCDQLIKKPFRFERICQALTELLDVDFVYDEEIETSEDDESSVSKEFDFASINLPRELYQRLKESAELSLITEVKKAVQEIEELGPDASVFAETLRNLIGSFETDNLIEFLEEHFE